jgi:hypothetical protein
MYLISFHLDHIGGERVLMNLGRAGSSFFFEPYLSLQQSEEKTLTELASARRPD